MGGCFVAFGFVLLNGVVTVSQSSVSMLVISAIAWYLFWSALSGVVSVEIAPALLVFLGISHPDSDGVLVCGVSSSSEDVVVVGFGPYLRTTLRSGLIWLWTPMLFSFKACLYNLSTLKEWSLGVFSYLRTMCRLGCHGFRKRLKGFRGIIWAR